MSELEWNWARHHAYTAARLHCPETVEELQAIVASATNCKALGSRHSFNDVADTAGDLISMQYFKEIRIDAETKRATVGAGVTYTDLGPHLSGAGFAVKNLASLPHISIIGACATATHGSGNRNQCLSASVCALEWIDGKGNLVRSARGEDPDFEGTVVAMGALGVVVRLTLELVPEFLVRQTVYDWLHEDTLFAHFDEITSHAYSVSLFTDWKTPSVNQVWVKARAEDSPAEGEFFGATKVNVPRHPIATEPADNCTVQLGIPGPAFDRLPHFRADAIPSSPNELQSEFLIPRPQAVGAIKAIAGMRDLIAPHLQITEIRTVAADDLWLSPFYQQDGVGIHFTWKKDWPNVSRTLQEIEKVLEPFGARPHWGKLSTMASERIATQYPRFEDFRSLRSRLDPEGKFLNPYLQRLGL